MNFAAVFVLLFDNINQMCTLTGFYLEVFRESLDDI